jgi:predicted MFS family arabinose efflux permease
VKVLPRRTAVVVFLAFAFAYFLSALVRAITATLSITLTQEFSLTAGDLGLLAGGYFLGFAAMQLPLGRWLDRHGPKKVLLAFLALAVAGCVAFSAATSFTALLAARLLCGAGVSACLMAPLTAYRRWLEPAVQLRANSWMLMSGSLGMVASTLPVQWLMPVLGWRAIFWGLAACIGVAMLLMAWAVPRWPSAPAASDASAGLLRSYLEVWQHPFFRSLVPMGFFSYGGLLAVQTLWASPWMIKVAHYSPLQAATGMFWLNVMMLCSFWLWGWVNPMLAKRGLHASRLMTLGLPLSFVFLAVLIAAGPRLGGATAALWALFCVSSTFVSLSQPAVAMAFETALAGRALSAFNLVIFTGVFVVQWGVGLLIDGFKFLGWTEIAAFQGALAVFLLCCVASYAYFLATKPHNQGL